MTRRIGRKVEGSFGSESCGRCVLTQFAASEVIGSVRCTGFHTRKGVAKQEAIHVQANRVPNQWALGVMPTSCPRRHFPSSLLIVNDHTSRERSAEKGDTT